jgi:glycosyltransferase involved in cell wall biosynthesis
VPADEDAPGTALVLTPTLPPITGRDMQGVNRRLSIFLAALGGAGGPIRLLRLVPPQMVRDWADAPARLAEIESEFWGLQVEVILAPRRSRTETLYTHYASGIVDIARQPDFFPFGGATASAEIRRQLEAPTTLVFVHRLAAMCALLGSGAGYRRMFFDLDDVEHRMRLRHVTQKPFWPGKLAYALHIPAVMRAEFRGAALSRATFVCSEPDRKHLARLGMPRVAVVPNAVEAPAGAFALPAEPTILFLGLMSYRPNEEAAARLAERIMPLIWPRVPSARLLIAGHGSESLPGSQGGDSRITYLGFVPDLAALYARTRIVCCPLINGGGTRVKLIEAAAYGKAIVATPCGAEGLVFTDGTEILLRNDDAALAQACIALLWDDAACARLGAAARRAMQENYAMDAVVRGVRAMIEGRSGG